MLCRKYFYFKYFYFREMKQTIFALDDFVRQCALKIPFNVELGDICIAFVPNKCLIKRYADDERAVYISPINIRINGINGDERNRYISRIDMDLFKGIYGDDVGIKFYMQKDEEIDDNYDINILKIDTDPVIYKDDVIYKHIIKGYNVTDAPTERIKKLIESHKEDLPFRFRTKLSYNNIEDEI